MLKRLLLFTICSIGLLSCTDNAATYSGDLASGTIDSYTDFPSEFVRPRNVDVWLPNDYTVNQKYQVLYMHDGQMLFDANTTWNKQEWKVDEHMGLLLDKEEVPPTIVVAIWNHSDIRWNDYFPWKAGKDGLRAINRGEEANNSDAYLKFIVEELKPFIDSKYATYTDMEHTAIAGSSMGGLISMYAICEYPDVFGSAACMSTHWIGVHDIGEDNPLPNSFFSYFKANFPADKKHRIYFDYGTETLDAAYLPYQNQVDEMIRDLDAVNVKFNGHDHSENSWNLRLDQVLKFILSHD